MRCGRRNAVTLASAALASWGCGGADNAGPDARPALEFVAVTAGMQHTCGLVVSGKGYCWGFNQFAPDPWGHFQSGGQLGDGSTRSTSVPVAVTGGLTFFAVTAGMEHTCGLTTSDAAYCWGWNDFGQLGDGSNTDVSVPVPVAGGLTFSAIAGGALHSCGVTPAGAAYCWGSNDFGQLGNVSTTASSIPVAVFGGLSFTAVAAGAYHTCGVAGAGVAYCWGRNDFGQLGNGTTTNSTVPVVVQP